MQVVYSVPHADGFAPSGARVWNVTSREQVAPCTSQSCIRSGPDAVPCCWQALGFWEVARADKMLVRSSCLDGAPVDPPGAEHGATLTRCGRAASDEGCCGAGRVHLRGHHLHLLLLTHHRPLSHHPHCVHAQPLGARWLVHAPVGLLGRRLCGLDATNESVRLPYLEPVFLALWVRVLLERTARGCDGGVG